MKFFDGEHRARKNQKKALSRRVVKKLRSYEKNLTAMLDSETEQAEIEKLERKIALVHDQRKHGLALMQEFSRKKKNRSLIIFQLFSVQGFTRSFPRR